MQKKVGNLIFRWSYHSDLLYYSPRDLLRLNSKARELNSLGKEARSKEPRSQEARSQEARSQEGEGLDLASEEASSQARVSAGGHLARPGLKGLLLLACGLLALAWPRIPH